MPFRSRPRSPTARSPSSIPRRRRKMPGVRAILHRENIGKIFRSTPGQGMNGICDRTPAAVRGRCYSLLRPIRRARGGGHFRERQSCGGCGSRYAMRKRNRTSSPTSPPTTIRTMVMTSYGPASACKASAAMPDGAFASAPVKLDQTYVTPAETHIPIELQANNRDVGRRQADDLRGIARHLQHARRARANVRFAERERARHHQICWLRFRQQTLAVDTLSAGGGGGAAARQTGQARA